MIERMERGKSVPGSGKRGNPPDTVLIGSILSHQRFTGSSYTPLMWVDRRTEPPQKEEARMVEISTWRSLTKGRRCGSHFDRQQNLEQFSQEASSAVHF
jgi:hypothetical protein